MKTGRNPVLPPASGAHPNPSGFYRDSLGLQFAGLLEGPGISSAAPRPLNALGTRHGVTRSLISSMAGGGRGAGGRRCLRLPHPRKEAPSPFFIDLLH